MAEFPSQSKRRLRLVPSPDTTTWTKEREIKAAGTHYLQLDRLPFQLDCPNLEVYPDSADIALGVSVVCES